MPLILFVLLLLLPCAAAGHPGKTDIRGGHRCLKECAEWNLYYAEYHLHDKDGRPIRVAAKKKSRKARSAPAAEPEPQPAAVPAATPALPVLPMPKPAPVIEDEEPCQAALPGGLLALLLLWLLVRRRRARDGERG